MKTRYLLFLAFVCGISKAQVNITTGTYFQNFGTANITSWANNSTFAGWYISGTFIGQANLSGSANSFNSGGFYSYNCGSDSKIGSRASSSASNLYYGVVLQNATGQTIRSIRVSYTGYQMSLASNGNAVNTISFDYLVSAASPAITAGGGTGVSALNFQQLQSTATTGGTQINWYPCTQSTVKSACIPVTIANNSYILLRWRDIDDSNNDHHMAIDDIEVAFDMTGGTCAVFLPVELLYFKAAYNGAGVDLRWATASEKNNGYFTVERSHNGSDFEELMQVKGATDASGKTEYGEEDPQPLDGISYYRLKQTDHTGAVTYSAIEAVEIRTKNSVRVFPNPTSTGSVTVEAAEGALICIIDALGQTVLEKHITDQPLNIDLSESGKGIYTLLVNSGGQIRAQKVVNE